jgi:hypothetical protein
MQRWYLVVLTTSLLACGRYGCEIEAEPRAECSDVGGTCHDDATCPSDTHRVGDHCDGLSFRGAVCCVPGAPPNVDNDRLDSGTVWGTDTAGTCNDAPCRGGCLCRSVSSATGKCAGKCECPPVPGARQDDVAADGDASAPDGDAGDPAASSPDASPLSRTCGVLSCATSCTCASASLSICRCNSNACVP